MFKIDVILWNSTIVFSGCHKKFSLVLLQITSYIYSLKNLKKNAICFKLFWYKVFVLWKLIFLMDFVLKEQLLVLSSTWRLFHLKFLDSSRNNKTATILVSQTNPVGVELISYVKATWDVVGKFHNWWLRLLFCFFECQNLHKCGCRDGL